MWKGPPAPAFSITYRSVPLGRFSLSLAHACSNPGTISEYSVMQGWGQVQVMYLSMSTGTSKMHEYKYECIFLQCTQVWVRIFSKVLEYKYEYIL